MKLNPWTRRALIAATFAFVALPASAQLKIGVVNLQKALQDTAEIKQAEADLKARFGPRQDEIAAMEKEIAKLSAEAEANQSKYNEQTMAELVTRIQNRQRQYQRSSQQLQDEVNRERQDILGRVGKRFQDVVKKVAEEKGLDFVVDMNNLLFNKPALDISVEVTAAYDKAYPAKQ
jgi:outer membrane protein